MREQSRRKEHAAPKESVEKIISEFFRLMNSNTVRECNRISGRKGSRVQRKFYKFIFDDEQDYVNFLKRLKRIKAILCILKIYFNFYQILKGIVIKN